uniref:Nucleoside phosphorylase domain-containing protein n=1 Tax=Globisporangium ultimum (strain ATCC 200006 / CBS 805.95 / DAOM BR144) TaxID=431595 RepID=K3XAD8_GLOUD
MADNSAATEIHILGVIGGSSLFHAKKFSASLTEQVVDTEYGGVVVHVGMWKDSNMQVVFIQRHHADPDQQYKQPRQINFKAIATVLKQRKCDAVIGVYSVGSMNRTLHVGRFVVPEDYFNPFDILHMSRHYDAHIVPDVTPELRLELVKILDDGKFDPHDGGVYVQTAGPRFETKAEVRFFAQFGDLIGMTGANEAELMNELRIPFAMFGLIDNMANGLGEKLTLEDFKITQKLNADRMEQAICLVLTDLADKKFLSTFVSATA